MTSPLETIPSEVLERIAIYAASSSIFDWPVEVSYLMQSRALHSALSIRSAPHVYAEIFASKFDISAPNRRYRHTSSFRAAELVNRYRLLKRCKRRDVSPTDLMQDLLTALWMFLESDGLNERQLRNVDFPNFMLQVARAQLKGVTAPIDPEAQRDGQASSLGHIIVWLLCFSLRRDEILKTSQIVRDELYGLIFPYIYCSSRDAISPAPACLKCSQTTTRCDCIEDSLDSSKPAGSSFWLDSSLQTSTYYHRRQMVDIPNSSAAAINLANVILESKLPKVPSHLLGNPTPVAGPTLDDYLAFKHYSTPLFADSCLHTSRSMLHDLEFRHQLRQAGLDRSHPAVKYSIGTMGGVWEGRYTKVGASLGEEGPFTFQRPIQCALAEYVSDDSGHGDIDLENLSFSGVWFDHDRSELLLKGGYRYRKYRGRTESGCHASQLPEFQHTVLYGETLDDHERAWDAFRFLGMVYEDGRVVLYRSAKHSIEEGIFAFEGRLRFGQVFVGRWRTSAAPDERNGIFSMTKH